MADRIHADYQALKEIVNKFNQLYSDMQPHQTKIANLMDEKENHWQGEAADAFEKDEGSFWQGFFALNETLQAAGEQIDKIAQILRDADEDAGQRLKATIQ